MKDGDCPAGHRFLFQVTDECTREEAILALTKIFGDAKASKAVLVPGVRLPATGMRNWVNHDKGFRAYIPVR